MKESWELEPGQDITATLQVIRLLGGGKLHEVLLATDAERLIPVVVKLLRPDKRTEDGLANLREEADLLEQARHPAFPRLLDLVESGDRPHLVMEHVEGPRLSRLVRRYGRLAHEQLLPLAVELAGALHYLHGLELIHIDIKPANLVVSDRVRVVDLGLARTFGRAKQLRGRVGTVSWMAPEQHRPEEGRVGPWSDVWAWGAVMFYATAGDWPIRHFRKEGGDDWILTRDEVDQVELPPRVPGVLAEAIRDALAWEPEDRPTPMDLAQRLEPMVDEMPSKPVLGRLRPTFTAGR